MAILMLVAVGWIYVVVMMAVAEATASNGTVLGALITFVLYGVLPLSIVLYLLATPMRKRAIQAREAAASVRPDPDGRGEPADAAVAPERKEP